MQRTSELALGTLAVRSTQGGIGYVRPLAVATNLAERFDLSLCVERIGRVLGVLALAALPLLAGCGGGGADAPQGGTVVGAAGGTVTGPGGATLVIPTGALATDTSIKIELRSDGAPALPGEFSAIGPMYAFTPHGLQFAVPVTLTLPFDVAAVSAGTIPALYKTNAQQQWERLDDVTFAEDTVSAQITGFSNGQAGVELRECPTRSWSLHATRRRAPSGWGNESWHDGAKVEATQTCGEVRVPFLFGTAEQAFEQDNGDTPGLAMGEVYSSPDGKSFSAYAEAPSGDPNLPDFRSGGEAQLNQGQSYVKRAPDATLQLVLSAGHLAAADFNGRPLPIECNNLDLERLSDEEIVSLCTPLMTQIEFLATAHRQGKVTSREEFDKLVFFSTRGDAWMYGFAGKWKFSASTHADSRNPLWTENNFTDTGRNGSAPLVALNGPLVIDIDLSSIEVCPPEKMAIFCGDRAFTISSMIRAETWNHRGRESGAAAYLRDPQNIGGDLLRTQGLEATNNPLPLPTEGAAPLPCAAGPDPAAGVLQWSAANFSAVEGTTRVQGLLVTRTQGSNGAVSVDFRADGGTGVSGVDYEALGITVRFADGDVTPRLVSVKLLPNTLAEPDKTVNLNLSAPGGCASLGTPSTAVLTILDDDKLPPVKPTFTVGGTVSGLDSTGLVLQDRAQFFDLPIAANGTFAFAQAYPASAAYDVRVKVPPTNPAQLCTVARGIGVVVNANVADIEVTCTTPPPPSGLDPSFGTLGKVVDGLPGGARAIARQSSGHVLATNGARLVRYHADGRLDTSFGGGAGFVDNLLTGSGAEVAHIDVHADDRIVLAGRILQPGRSPPFYQMAAARLLADGTRDSAFGSAGTATFRLAGASEYTTRVLAQPDGRVLLVGQASSLTGPSGSANNDIALVRLNADGTLDAGFGSGGAVLVDALLRDFAFAAALQPDGRIFVAGRTSDNNADNTNTLFTRLAANGAIEPGFGRSPAYSNLDDEAVDVALQPDGKFVLLVAARGVNNEIMVVRLNADGSPDTAFGNNGIVRSDIGPHDDIPRAVAVQLDGKIVVAAQVSNASPVPPSFAVLRYGADGAPDATFGSNGVLSVPFFGGLDSANDLLVQPDGRIVVAGSWRSSLSVGIALIRLMP